MAITSIFGTSIEGDADNDGDWGTTIDVNFPPQAATPSVTIFSTTGDGRSSVGIRSFQFRDTPSGPNRDQDFGPYSWNWPPAWFNLLMTRVTFGISLYDNACRAWCATFFWS